MGRFAVTTAVAVIAALFSPRPEAYVITRNNASSLIDKPVVASLVRRAGDPTDFSWVHRFAALGDSFTAGIGSGIQLGGVFHNKDDWTCSRYDQSYPMLVNNVLGPSVDDFQFKACSGDRSVQIYKQAQEVSGNLDMVIMTAGGNDLCLAAMIKKCVMVPFDGEDTCTAVINKAQTNIDTILKPNLKQILLELDGKMAKDGIVVYNGYARYFSTANEACANDQKWYYLKWFPTNWFKTGLKLTIARRNKFNDLVININKAIREVIKDVQDEVKYTIGFSDWDLWPIEGVKGQMCDPSGEGRYPDPKQPDLQFFKPDTYIGNGVHDELRKRQEEALAKRILGDHPPVIVDGIDQSIYDTLLWKSPDPRAEVLHQLDKRAPSPPDCPGDKDWFDPTLGIGMPDSFGKMFHPNEIGHNTIASFLMAKAIDLRAKVIGAGSETCAITDEFKCWQKEGRKNSYASADRLNENYKDFCNNVKAPDNTVGWKSEKTYHEGTPDEHSFLLQLGEDTADFNKDDCLESFRSIINDCDGNDPENPMNWKFGGRKKNGEYTYEVNIKRTNRPWPLKKAHGWCKGDYKFLFGSYTIYGAGFSDWDYGQQTMIPNMKGCFGLGITAWKFDYFDSPDKDGYEWKSTFRTPIWVRARCFANNKVVNGAGGDTGGCSGSD